MINFNNEKEIPNTFFGGSEQKRAYEIDGKIYMVKFPDPVRQKKNGLSYMNNQFSEYIGCHIFRALGIPAQNTFLGDYQTETGKRKIVVACENFCTDGYSLMEFSKLARAVASSNDKFPRELGFVMKTIDDMTFGTTTDKESFKAQFWDMFVADTLIGNDDRHLDNWGFLVKGNHIRFAPVYDCGSALTPLMEDEKMAAILKDETAFINQEYNVKSAYRYQGKRLFYHEIYKNPPQGLKEAILRIVPRIDVRFLTTAIVETTPEMSNIRKTYLAKALDIRSQRILIPAWKRARKEMSLSLEEGRSR
ncbi:HipA domain-containing protein [Selenomonas bovis]|uniref:HipA domain-containing protein n=1 Tax=Selenomonas bovis TaxID=416586 RepID=UPI0003689A46|nr:HipA domain-containing protein [Selenomonas bovis]